MKNMLPILAALALAATGSASAERATHHPQHPRGHAGHALDSNGDGFVDRMEASAHARLVENFDRIDTDHDGRLSRAEFRAHHTRMQGERIVRQLDASARSFAAADLDGDGVLSPVEAQAAAIAITPEAFAALDLDGDGNLSATEFNAHALIAQRKRMRRGHPMLRAKTPQQR